MTIGVLAVLFFVVIILFLFIFWNSLQSRTAKEIPKSLLRLEKLYQKREELLINLKDLENDLSLNKVEQKDYTDLKNRFLSSAAEVYNEIDTLEKSDPFLKAVADDLKKISGDSSNAI